MSVDLARETALKILYDINEKGAYSNITLNKYLERDGLRVIDRGFITELVYGTVKWRLTLDWVVRQFSTVKFNKISPWILNVLRLGAYQILYMDRIPDSAACNESVKLSKKYGHHVSSRFVNGVLRNIARSSDDIKYPQKGKDYIQYLCIKYSHPEWIVKRFVELYGREFTEDLLNSNNEVPDFTVRVNTLKISRDRLLEALKQEGVEAAFGKYSEEAVIIKNPSSIARLEAFRKGYFQVQDESSMLVGRILDPQPGDFVVDVCSAPGGKATHVAQIMNNKGTVIARDIHEHKIHLIENSVKRLGINIVRTELFDALRTDESLIEKADRVLVDAPCTGLGIIRRKPDIKWARNTRDTKEITRLQREIIKAASRYVKPGGVMVYSTCTLLPEENEGIVKEFIDSNQVFELEDISSYLPENLKKQNAEDGYIHMFPNVDGSDGFFIARLKKRG